MELKSNAIYIFRTYQGEEIIATLNDVTEKAYSVKAPMTLLIDSDGKGGIMPIPQPFAMFAKDPLKVKFEFTKNGIFTIYEAHENLKEMYTKIVAQANSNIVLPQKPQLITG